MNVHVAYWTMVLLAIVPMPLLLTVWLGWLIPRTSLLRLLLLAVATASYLWLVLGVVFPALLLDYYSIGRFAILDGNFLLMLVCIVFAFRGNERRKAAFISACVVTALMWSVEAAINSVV